MVNKDKARTKTTGEKTVYKSMGFCGFVFNRPSMEVDIKDGEIIRVRPEIGKELEV